MGAKRISMSVKEKIATGVQSGENRRILAKRLKVSDATVYKVAREANITRTGKITRSANLPKIGTNKANEVELLRKVVVNQMQKGKLSLNELLSML